MVVNLVSESARCHCKAATWKTRHSFATSEEEARFRTSNPDNWIAVWFDTYGCMQPRGSHCWLVAGADPSHRLRRPVLRSLLDELVMHMLLTSLSQRAVNKSLLKLVGFLPYLRRWGQSCRVLINLLKCRNLLTALGWNTNKNKSGFMVLFVFPQLEKGQDRAKPPKSICSSQRPQRILVSKRRIMAKGIYRRGAVLSR